MRFLCSLIVLVGVAGSLADAGLTREEKQMILDAHNFLRAKIAKTGDAGQPTASNMAMLEWDDEAARMAQSWANKCVSGHDHNRKYAAYGWVGQNFAGGYPLASGVKAWYDEIKEYRYESKYCSGICGHYTQLVWAKTFKVGCGKADCQSRGAYNNMLFCNYAPGGNFNNEAPYKRGSACSKCPATHPNCKNGLCVSSRPARNNQGIMSRVLSRYPN